MNEKRREKEEADINSNNKTLGTNCYYTFPPFCASARKQEKPTSENTNFLLHTRLQLLFFRALPTHQPGLENAPFSHETFIGLGSFAFAQERRSPYT